MNPPILGDSLAAILRRFRDRVGVAPPEAKPVPEPRVNDLPARHVATLRGPQVRFRPMVSAQLRRLLEELRKPRAERRGLYLWGPPGVGKTLPAVQLVLHVRTRAAEARLAALTTWEAAPAGTRYEAPRAPRCAFVEDREIIRRAREAMNGGPSFGAWAESLVTADLLVLDDLASGTETPYTAYEAGLLGELLDAAYRDGTLLFVTSNKSLDDLARILGPRISSRIVEACEVREYAGADRRLASVGGQDAGEGGA